MEDFEKMLSKKEEELKSILSDDFIDEIGSSSSFMQIGGKVFELKLSERSFKDVEDIVKSEMKDKIVERLRNLGRIFSKKIEELSTYTRQYNKNLIEKINEYDKLIKDIYVMPDVNMNHAMKGVSVVKGKQPGGIIYLVRGVYWPKTITIDDGDTRNIKSSLSRKLMTPVIFYLEVDGSGSVIELSTRKLFNLDYFDHYHQQMGDGDCWGTWDIPSKCEDASKAINIAKKAQLILENIYKPSITNEEPKGLPNLDILVRTSSEDTEGVSPSNRISRTGLDRESMNNREESVWEIRE